MYRRDVRQHLGTRLVVKSDPVPLREFPEEEEPERDVLGSRAEHRVAGHSQCSGAVAVDGYRSKGLESDFRHEVGDVNCLVSTEAPRLKFGLHGVLCCESLCLGSVADQSPS
ncbi:unnamed protein product [Ectocarpus sp. CCAP 1310/34]|nr:unnamed protein product [Ectocarpus sp. CCAP 1310/34]